MRGRRVSFASVHLYMVARLVKDRKHASPQLLANLRHSETSRIFIEDVYPSIDNGRFAAKRIVGDAVEVWADIFRDGHDILTARILWGIEGELDRQAAVMTHHGNDRWFGSFVPNKPGRYVLAIEAWTNTFASWQRDLKARQAAGQPLEQEIEEGWRLLDSARITPMARRDAGSPAEAFRTLAAEDLAETMAEAQPQVDRSVSQEFPLRVDRIAARSSAWYEMVPRSQGTQPDRGATFDDCIARLPDIAALGFDVVYLTPIHPIGTTNRKGRNNSVTAEPGEPGSFYAIGAAEGGHDAVHPDLGGIEAFRRFVAACRDHRLEVALDFAIQCSPDHPWLTEHPDWFKRRPDGTIRYAENPPKKYEDIINVDFYCADWANLWKALRDVVLFWVGEGVKIFRVDNPHTKPFPFWEWMIREVQQEDPDVLFLSEAFTRPKVMKALAKLGFSQSYTYFTWRTTKAELTEYLTELTAFPTREFYRPNFFVTTPDILPHQLQGGDPWVFKARFALAATLSSAYGIYNGFELLEHEPLPGKEEYLNSEKYEFKVRDWNRPGNIKAYIAQLNRIRRENPALQQTSDLRILQVDHDSTIGFLKEAADGGNAVACAIAVAGAETRQVWLHFGEMMVGPRDSRRKVTALVDLTDGTEHRLEWGGIRLTIDPQENPLAIFRCVS